jgi:hypothetical protein
MPWGDLDAFLMSKGSLEDSFTSIHIEEVSALLTARREGSRDTERERRRSQESR